MPIEMRPERGNLRLARAASQSRVGGCFREMGRMANYASRDYIASLSCDRNWGGDEERTIEDSAVGAR